MIVLVLTVLMALSLVACQAPEAADKVPEATDKAPVKIPNPFVDCDTLDKAVSLAEFDMVAPDSIEGYSQRTIRAMKGSMIEVIYQEGENEIRVRKAPGTEDISGDFTEYAENNTVSVGDLEVTMRGDEGNIRVAIWTQGEYTFSLSCTAHMSSEDISDLIQMIE